MDGMETSHETQAAPRDGRWRGTDPAPVPAGMETMTRKQAAELWGVDPRVVTRYVTRGLLRKYVTDRDQLNRPGRVVFDAEEVRRVGKLRRVESEAEAAVQDPPQRKRW